MGTVLPRDDRLLGLLPPNSPGVHCCPTERPVKRLQVGTGQPLAALDGTLIDPKGEAGVLVAELFRDVDGLIASGSTQARVRAPEGVRRNAVADRLDAQRGESRVGGLDSRLEADGLRW